MIVAHLFTADEKITPRKLRIAVGFAGVAVMIGPGLLSTSAAVFCRAGLRRRRAGLCAAGVWARRFKAMGVSPFSVTTGQLTVGAAMMVRSR